MTFILGIALLVILAALTAAAPLWRRERKPQAVFAAAFVVMVAGGVYLLIGRPDLGIEPPQPFEQQADDVVAMVEQLAQRLERAPDDPEGWAMLGHAYVLMGRYQEAASAFSEAIKRTSVEDPDLMASFAEARALNDPASMEGETGTLFERVLELDPENPRGLWYGGLSAQARGDDAVALARWRRLLARDLPEEFRRVVEGRVASIDPAAVGALVSVRVDVAENVRNLLPTDGVLYVFLRPAGEADGGTPPLAARRVDYFEFPETLPLTASDLLRGGELPEGEFTITARLSADGDPQSGAGDVEGSVRWNPAETASVELRLDTHREQ